MARIIFMTALAIGLLSPQRQWSKQVEQIATLIETEYVDASKAKQIAFAIRDAVRAGRYDRASSARELAETLTADLYRNSSDKHLAVTLNTTAGPSGPALPRAEAVRRSNGGVQRVEILDGNVGYLNLTAFWRLNEAHDALVEALKLLSRADAWIIDMRSNGGGSPDTVGFLIGHLLQTGNAPLFDIVSRDGEANHFSTPALEVTMTPRPIYILTSAKTFSAGEGFPFLLQERKVAEVIGEKTPGAANPGAPHNVDEFVITIPNGMVKTAFSGRNWEGSGVTPDVETSATEALNVALARAREKLQRQ